MSEGPEVRRTADRLAEVLVGRRIENIELRKRSVAPGDQLTAKVVGTRVKAVRTYGKHIVIAFTGSLYLHNHMMMWGKWRTYPRRAFEEGKAKPPPRVQWRRARGELNTQVVTAEDVRADSRVRLILATGDHVAIEFNGPIVRFSKADPAKQGAIERLGPDALVRPFSSAAVRARARERGTKTLADLLLDQSFVAGIGNKYKSDFVPGRPLPLPACGLARARGNQGADCRDPAHAPLRLRKRRAHATAASRRAGELLGASTLGVSTRWTSVLALWCSRAD